MNCKLYAGVRDGQYGFWTNPTKNKPTEFISLGKAITIERITQNLETNEVRLELAMDYMGEPITTTISREDLSDNRLIQSLNKIGAHAPKHYFDTLVASIMKQEAILEQDGYRPEKVYSHLGWLPVSVRDETGTITGRQLHYRAAHLIGSLSAKYDGQYSVTPMGDLDSWRQMVKEQIIGHPPLELVLLASLSAIVNGLIGPLTTGENPIFHLCGPSGCGKTTALYAATSVYGVPYEGEKRYAATNGEAICERSVYGSWGATENSTTAQCCGNMGAAIIFNELGKFDGKDLTRIVYNLSEGTDKVRLDPKMTSYTSESYATSIISSGEISLLSRCTSKATGLQVRVLEISDQLTDNAEQSRTIKDVCRKHNGHAAPAFAQYILDNGDRRLALPIYQKYCKSLPTLLPVSSTSARFIEKFPALIMATAELASDALDLPFDMAGILNYFVQHEASTAQSRNVLADSYKVVIDACSTNQASFYIPGQPEPLNKCYGRITYPCKHLPDGRCVVEQYEIRRGFLEEVLSKNNFPNSKACYQEWRKLGVLDCDADRYTRSRKIGKVSTKCEDVFVLRVFGDPPTPTPSKPRSKLTQHSTSKPSAQLATLLNNKEDEDND